MLELLQSVCQEFSASPSKTWTRPTPRSRPIWTGSTSSLLRTHAVGQNNVLIIDEAQTLSSRRVGAVAAADQSETSERKLLQIILIGQPELRDMLARPEMEQLAQRVIARFHLEALSEAETDRYIAHRLAWLASSPGTLFDPAAVRRIHQVTPRGSLPNQLAVTESLLAPVPQANRMVSEDIVTQAAVRCLSCNRAN